VVVYRPRSRIRPVANPLRLSGAIRGESVSRALRDVCTGGVSSGSGELVKDETHGWLAIAAAATDGEQSPDNRTLWSDQPHVVWYVARGEAWDEGHAGSGGN